MPCAEAKELLQAASSAVAKEKNQLPQEFDIDCGRKGYVTARHRDSSLYELLRVSQHFGFESETFANAALLTDRFLGRVKVYPKYMQCISMAGLLIAAKLNEEEEFIPTVNDFIRISRCGCSAGDLKRMEKLMVDKLEWDLLSVTPVFFLHEFLRLFVAIGVINSPDVNALTKHLIPQLLTMMCKKSICQHRGSLLVLCLLGYELEQTDSESISRIVDVARFLGVSDHEFVHCLGMVTDFMELPYGNVPTVSRKRKRSAMFVTPPLPTIVEASQTELEDEELYMEVTDSLSLKDGPNPLPQQSIEAVDKQIHLQQQQPKPADPRPLYSTVVKSSCGTLLHEDLHMYKDQALVY